MKVFHNPSVKFDSEDIQTLSHFEDLINMFDDDFCSRTDCDDCLFQNSCNEIFLGHRPYEDARKILRFFSNIPVEEG